MAALYNSKLAGAEGGYKDRVQDYAADKKFDNAYGKRDVDNFDFIKLWYNLLNKIWNVSSFNI